MSCLKIETLFYHIIFHAFFFIMKIMMFNEYSFIHNIIGDPICLKLGCHDEIFRCSSIIIFSLSRYFLIVFEIIQCPQKTNDHMDPLPLYFFRFLILFFEESFFWYILYPNFPPFLINIVRNIYPAIMFCFIKFRVKLE